MSLSALGKIGLWIWENRKLVAFLAAMGGLFLIGMHYGARGVQADWDAAVARNIQATEEKRLEDQRSANEKEANNVKVVAALNKKVDVLQRKLAHEIVNPAYRCEPTADGLQSLNDIRSAARRAASQRYD